MRTWTDNAKTINQLWQTFEPTEELRWLFRDTLAPLNQDVLYIAIKKAKVDNEGPWPALKWILTAYAHEQSIRRTAAPKDITPVERTKVPLPDPEDERKLADDLRKVIGSCQDEQFRQIESMVLDKFDAGKLSAAVSYTLLAELRSKVFGGPGLTYVTVSGEFSSGPELIGSDA